MHEHIPSSIIVKIIHETGEIGISAPQRGGPFRDQLLKGYLEKELLEQLVLKIDSVKYDVPYTSDGMTTADFFKHIQVCIDLHEAFYKDGLNTC